MTNDNIFSGLKVVDLASFIAGPGAAVILSDFGADVIKVEPPRGDLQRIVYKVPPQPRAKDNYPWHLDNRNKRGLAVDLKSPHARGILLPEIRVPGGTQSGFDRLQSVAAVEPVIPHLSQIRPPDRDLIRVASFCFCVPSWIVCFV